MTILLILASILSLRAALDWHHVYFSGAGNLGQRAVRIAATQSVPYLLLRNGGQYYSPSMLPVNDGFGNYQCTTLDPSPPYIGFRQYNDSSNVIIPIHYDQAAPPSLADLTPAFPDPAGDITFTETHLDILETHIATGPDKMYFAIVNNGGGFPVNSDYYFYSYMAALIDPATADDPLPTVWGLMYTVDVGGIIEPGLYRIEGTSVTDLELIGEIGIQILPAQNCLILSCNKADLLADPQFSAWFDADDPLIGCQFMTNKISLVSGTMVADLSEGFNFLDVPIPVPQQPAGAPVITGAQVIYLPDWNLEFSADYQSPEHYLTLTAQVIIDQTHTFDLAPTPDSFPDFNSAVHYVAEVNPITIGNWNEAVLRFSADDIVWTEVTLANTFIQDEHNDGCPAPLVLRHYPNPARDRIYLEMDRSVASAQAALFNLKGQKLLERTLQNADGKACLDLRELASRQAEGIYFIRVESGSRSQTSKLIILK